jgi:hypothetical protein
MSRVAASYGAGPHQRLVAAAVFSCVVFAPSQSYSECTANQEECVALELSARGKRGDTIERAREQVIDILQHGNACSAWFQEADPDATEVFRSVHFELEVGGTSYVYSVRDSARGQLFKHPWAARTTENGGRNSVIQLNGNGAFFNRTSRITQLDPGGTFAWPAGDLMLTISWDGRSLRNTSEVSRHCKSETRVAAHNSSRVSIRAHNSGV